ncbi:alpha/beta hydrolase [Pseudenhygromyxa sp. WMMC2535]|uniref:alpha/beta fold hydrolase n=1 Tax=Pseudenhygromyxa sp. WMMC2535 TaxID=2712867 RepID=UPI001551AFC8|nr:alpha/beta hydrolase [Pseudenhygromyxa sp. WMMC2535]NVB43603.1 alpha/beta hydrolase [Pseudenhygromyxa sp. WMMC2535]
MEPSWPEPRDIPHLSADLGQVIDALGEGREVVLVAHSLGGMIIRDYALEHPEAVAAMVFVDSAHESYNQPTQAEEDMIVETFSAAYGPDDGATAEARQLIEDSAHFEGLPGLPDVPVIVLTSMKIDADHDAEDRQLWFEAHERLGEGISDFEHVVTEQAGHYIMLEDPQLVRAQLSSVL